MPGKTKKKTPNTKRLYQPYSKENFQLALEAVTEKKMSQRSKSNFWSSSANNFRLCSSQPGNQ